MRRKLTRKINKTKSNQTDVLKPPQGGFFFDSLKNKKAEQGYHNNRTISLSKNTQSNKRGVDGNNSIATGEVLGIPQKK